MNLSPGFRRVLPFFVILFGLIGLMRVRASFHADIHTKDFIQEWLMARALLDGANPYEPVPVLAVRYVPLSSYSGFPHSTPHTPTLGLLSAPLGLLDYESAAALWTFIDAGCLAAFLALLCRLWPEFRPMRAALIFVAMLGWPPVAEELGEGQIGGPLLLLAFAAWVSLRDGRDGRGGLAIGLMLALKLAGGPLLIYLAIRRRWRAVMAGVVTACAANLMAGLVIGYEVVLNYYLRIGPRVAELYRANDYNLSAWGWGRRVFEGGANFLQSPPLIESPMLSVTFTYLTPLTVLVIGTWWAARSRGFDSAFAALTVIGMLISPVAWPYYLVSAGVGLAILVRHLYLAKWPRNTTVAALVAGGLFAVSQAGWASIALVFQTGQGLSGRPIVPAGVGLITLIPALSLVGIVYLIHALDAILTTNNRGNLSCSHNSEMRKEG
jgi:hypothetical protein